MRLILFFIPALLCGQMSMGVVGDTHHSSTVATPTDSPGAGNYGTPQTVTLSDATSGATICYTIDGSTPGAATPGTCNSSPTTTYSTGISVAATTTVKAIGTKATMTNSGVMSSVYTISSGITAPTAISAFSGGVSVTTGTLATTVGQTAFVYAGFDGNGSGCNGKTIIVTDLAGNTYSAIGSQINQPYACSAMFESNITHADASNTFTVTATGNGTPIGIAVALTTGCNSTTPLDQSSSGYNLSGTQVIVGTPLTTTTANEIIFAGVWNYYSGVAADTGAGYVIPSGGRNTAGTGQEVAIEYKIVSSTQTGISPKMTMTTAYGGIGVAAYK